MRRGLDRVDEVMARATGAEVVVGIGGVVVGLLIATLISIALVRIPIVGPYLTVPIYLLAGYFTAYLAAKKHIEILRLLGVRGAFEVLPGLTPAKLLDTSAIIDGRILDIVNTGFVEGELLVPRFVVEELQHLADSADAEKRVRGRRGLDFVQRLQNSSGAVRIDGTDYADIDAVDAKLVRYAKDSGAQIITTDYTLKKVAEIQGVKLLNVNDLANSVKPAVLPGEIIEVKIQREGREQDQGVGYLDDGTMIVVEAGSPLVGSRVKAEVTSVLQSPSGKMIFSRSVPPRTDVHGPRLSVGQPRGGRHGRDGHGGTASRGDLGHRRRRRREPADGPARRRVQAVPVARRRADHLALGPSPARHELCRRPRRRAASVAHGALRQRAPGVRRRQAAAHRRGRRDARDSVRAGLLEVPDTAAVIAVHDGARPLFSRHVFEACLAALGTSTAPCPASRSATRSSARATAARSPAPWIAPTSGPCRRRRSSAPTPCATCTRGPT